MRRGIIAILLSVYTLGCHEGLVVIRERVPVDGAYKSQSLWLVEPPTSEHLGWEWEWDIKKGGYTTIQIDRESSSVSIRSATCDTESCNEIRAVAPHTMSALESSEGIRFTIEDALVIRPGPYRGIDTTAFDWSENRVLPTAEDLDAVYGGGD